MSNEQRTEILCSSRVQDLGREDEFLSLGDSNQTRQTLSTTSTNGNF